MENLLQNEHGDLKKVVDLEKHQKDSGRPISDAMLQQIGALNPEIEQLNLRNCSFTDLGLW